MSKTMSKIITIEVSRYRPEIDAKPWLQSFQVEWTQDMSVLDAPFDVVKNGYFTKNSSIYW